MAGQRIGKSRVMVARKRERKLADELEAGNPISQRLLRVAEQGDGMLDIPHGSERSHPDARSGVELQHDRGDDAQRSFSADEKLLEIEPRIDLAESTQSVPHPTVGQNDFDAQ